MNYKVKEDFTARLTTDIDKAKLGQGVILGGSIKDNKIKLYTTDVHGKHSNFATRIFYGKLIGNTLKGKFFISCYVCVLLAILAAVCIESIIMAVVSDSPTSVVFPAVIIVIEIIYLFSIKRISAENDMYIKKYLEDCTVED